jgi:hypothetical protein
MARTRKSVSTQNLIKYDVLVEDRGMRSDYFKISQFDGYLYGGRNAFLVAGSGVLRPRSKVLVEVLNKDGSTIFSAPVSSFVEGNSRLIQVEVYEDAPIGPGKIVILGSADTYIDGTPIPREWQGKYNVRWITDVIISPRIENRTQIRFQRPPSMTVSEKFYFAPSSSAFESSRQLPLDIEFSPKFLNVYPNGYLAKIITSGSLPSATARYFSNYAGGVLSGSVKFVGPQGPETASIRLPLDKIYTSKLAESDGNLIVTDRNRILNSLIVSSSGQYTTNISPIGSVGVTSSLNLVYNELTTQDTGSILSFADIRVVDLETISGEINKIRFSYKPATRPGAYKVIGEITNEVDELFAVDTGSRIAETGRFRDVVTDDYWYTATMSVAKNEINPIIPTYYVTSSLVTGSSVTQCCTDLLDSINATPEISGSTFIDNVSYFIGNKDNNSIELFPRSEYTLTLDALVTKESASYSLSQPDYSLDVYLVPISGSTKLLETNPLGQLIGTLTPRTGFKSQRFNQVELNFVPSIIRSGEFGIRFVVYGGFWNIANVSVKTATEPFFSPDEVDALLPIIDFDEEILEFRAEYLDVNNNSIGIETVSLPTYFTGSRRYVLRSGDTMFGDLTLIESASIIVTGSGDITVDGGDIFVKNGGDVYVNELPLYYEVLNDMTTGLVTGGLLITSSEYSQAYIITSGSGIIINNETNPLDPTYSYVYWGDLIVTASAFLTSGSVASYPRTNVAINSNGSVHEQADKFTVNDYRNKIVLGRLAHVDTTNIQRTLSLPLTAYGRGYHWFDFIYSAGNVNVSGNIYGPYATDLRIEKSAGSTYRIGSNYKINPARPDIKEDPVLSPVTFAYRYRDGLGGWKEDAETQIITGSRYDDGDGTLGTVNNNQWTVQRIFFFSATNTTRIQPGQFVYNAKEDAQIAAASEEVEINPNLAEDAIFRGFLILRGGAADLSNPNDAEFLQVVQGSTAGGGAGAIALSSLTDVSITSPSDNQLLVYNNSNAEWENETLTVTAGAGLTGGGNLATSPTINVGAGTGIDVAADAISVDVSDFMTNGVDNRVLTATGTDGMNAEANMTFDGSILTVTGEIRATSEVTAYYSSDINLKTNITPLINSLLKLNQLHGVEFDWKQDYIDSRGGEDDYFVRRHDVGVIAQEVQAVLPEVVATRQDGTLAVRYEKIVPLLIEAIKELNAKVEYLESRSLRD